MPPGDFTTHQRLLQEPGEIEMSNSTVMLTVAEFANLVRSGEITMRAVDTDLQVPPLAELHNEECYPDTTIEVKRGDEVIASVWCWRLGWYERGPNRCDTGEYIGNGWRWLTDDSDGQSTGRPRESHRRDGTISWGADNSSLVIPYDEDVSETDVDTISQALSDAYDEISVRPAYDDDVYTAMVATRADESIDIEVNDDTISVDLFANHDAGRTVYTFDGAEEIWEDADDCVKAALKYLSKQIDEQFEEIDADQIAANLAVTLED